MLKFEYISKLKFWERKKTLDFKLENKFYFIFFNYILLKYTFVLLLLLL